MRTDQRLLIVGNPGEVHVGRHLAEAGRGLGLQVAMCNSDDAFSAPRAVRVLNWHLRCHRPARLRHFGETVLDRCEQWRPDWVVATGLAPLDREALDAIGELGIRRLNFLTDDPWNPTQGSRWFMDALPSYDDVFSPRTANIDDLRSAGCSRVRYVPFAYAPDVHFPDPPATEDERRALASDVVFVGGADADRVPWIAPLIETGFRVALYGGYWTRFSETRGSARGWADASMVRKAVGAAETSLCLVRQANRDGHAMRSFEVPAIGSCMVVEDTPEHREIFGPDEHAVKYVREPDEARARIAELLDNAVERKRLSAAAHELIVKGDHTWRSRLEAMLAPW